jgi:hypothetical protein
MTASGVHMATATLLAAMPSTDYENSYLNPREALRQYYRSMAGSQSQLPNAEDRCHSCKPARHSWSFASIHQEFMWLSFQILELTFHKLKNSYTNNVAEKNGENIYKE